jgi:hypothetical protein
MIEDTSLAALLDGTDLPAGAAPELHPLAHALAGLRGQPARDELAGEAETLAAFRRQFTTADGAQWPPATKRRALRSRPLAARAAGAAAAVLGLAGIATAAYAGELPPAAQRLAHDILGAPAPATRPAGRTPLSTPGHAAYGLCTAWAHAREHGTHQQQAAAFGNLAAAAGGAGNVTAYCAAVPPASRTPAPSRTAQPAPHGSGRPTALPTPHGSGQPTALPTPHGSGQPTALPTPHGSGQPTALPTPHGSGQPTALPTPHGSGQPTALPTPHGSGQAAGPAQHS